MTQDLTKSQKSTSLLNAPLGERRSYTKQYDPNLLFAIPRQEKRIELGISAPLPFKGFDRWNTYELSWLDCRGKPIVAIGEFDIAVDSKNIIESKSLKLYLTSLNQTKFCSLEAVQSTIQSDLAKAVEGEVSVRLFTLFEFACRPIATFAGESIDELQVECDTYSVHPDYLTSDPVHIVKEVLYSDLLKSNCLVTGQPDWGSIQIAYEGAKIDRKGLLRYIVSFREHQEFHEQCAERIFIDILRHCQPHRLTVYARYTRRGGIDINPIRSNEDILPVDSIRLVRQ